MDETSVAVPINDEVKSLLFFNKLSVIILTHKTEKKKTSSTKGMQTSVRTSKLINSRLQNTYKTCIDLIKSIKNQNHEQFFEVIMRESNNFHAICQDSYPPLLYLNDFSRWIINLIHEFNDNTLKCGYTFDAGPYPVIFVLNDKKKEFIKIITQQKE